MDPEIKLELQRLGILGAENDDYEDRGRRMSESATTALEREAVERRPGMMPGMRCVYARLQGKAAAIARMEDDGNAGTPSYAVLEKSIWYDIMQFKAMAESAKPGKADASGPGTI